MFKFKSNYGFLLCLKSWMGYGCVKDKVNCGVILFFFFLKCNVSVMEKKGRWKFLSQFQRKGSFGLVKKKSLHGWKSPSTHGLLGWW